MTTTSATPEMPRMTEGDIKITEVNASGLTAIDADTAHPLPSDAPDATLGQRDWPEDFPHENGNYLNKCVTCGCTFVGHKRRVTCRVCASPPQDAPVDLSAVEAAIARYADAAYTFRSSKSPDVKAESKELNDSYAALLSLYRTALSGVPAKEAGEDGR